MRALLEITQCACARQRYVRSSQVSKGLLSESALAFFWHGTRLDVKHYRHAALMLCDAGVLFELPLDVGPLTDLLPEAFLTKGLLPTLLPNIFGEERERQYTMPMRLPEARPSTLESKWPTVPKPGEAELGVRYSFFGLNPPTGAIERLVAGCSSNGKLRDFWRFGAVIEGRPSALVQRVIDDDGNVGIAVDVRAPGTAPALWSRLLALTKIIDGVLGEYSGRQYDARIVCPSCTSAGRTGKAAFAWDFAKCRDEPSAKPLHCDKCARQVEIRPTAIARSAATPRSATPKAAAIKGGDPATLPQAARLPPPRAGFASIPRPKREFSAFFSFDSLTDDLGRDNRQRVSAVAGALHRRGKLKISLDGGDNPSERKQRIDDSACVVVFVTEQYTTKASGDGPRGGGDMAKLELDYATRRKGVDKVVVAVMEPACRTPWEWYGTAGEKLGTRAPARASHP